MTLKAYCDRCGEEIIDYQGEENTLVIVNGRGMAVESFDLCGPCGTKIDETISVWIKGGDAQ